MNPFRVIQKQIYFLQLENFDLKRFWMLVSNFRHISSSPIRQELVWTPKLLTLTALAIILAIIFISLFSKSLVGIIFAVVFVIYFFFVFLILSNTILYPLDSYLKDKIINNAKKKLTTFKKLKIIGITGSFGKTTMKECLTTMLSEKYKVLKTPDSINTPLGISRLILEKLDESTDIFVVEMGAYQKGDIARLCGITRPDVAILTGINEAHLERFGTIQNTIEAKFEIVSNAKPGALVILSADNDLIRGNYQKFANGKKVIWYTKDKPELAGINTQLLGSYALGTISACVIIARELGLTEDQFRAGISKIKPIPHRLELIPNPNGVTVIDDSYNGNPDGVDEAIKVLASYSDKRRIYITPGLVEMQDQSEQIHKEIGRKLASAANLVILIKNSVTPFIADGLKSEGFNEQNILWFDSAVKAHSSLKDILKSGDVILFQNDWPDNYL